MKERWKVIEKLLSDEYDIEVQASYEGWGAGYDPKFLPLTEMWAKGEIEDVPEAVKRPSGIAFYLQEVSNKPEEEAINIIRHEIEYLFSTDLYLWRLGQREFYKFGFTPTSFLVLYAVLESIKTDERLIKSHPDSLQTVKKHYKNILNNLETYYPHHLFALSLLENWLGEGNYQKDIQKFLQEYLNAKSRDAYDIIMENLFGRYMSHIEKAQDINYVDLLLEEARGRTRVDAHRGRIMTDLLKKLPEHLQEIIVQNKDKRAVDISETDRKEILKSLKAVPEWMRDYLKQMSYINLIERDVEFIRHFLPKTLEVDIEHRGFLSFIIKGWEEQSSSSSQSGFGRSKREKTEEDRLYEKAYGLGKEDFMVYKRMLSDILPHIDALKRKLVKLMPQEEEGWTGKHFYGRRIDTKSLSVEAPLGRGRIYMRRHIPVRKELAFKLLIDISTSMKREDKIQNAIKALLLFSEVIESLKMSFSIDVFSDRVFRLKAFSEDYKSVKWKIIELFNLLGGGTNLEKALIYSYEDLQTFCLKNHIRGCIVVFSDGEPTRGLKGQELKSLIAQIKARIPIIGIGVGTERNYTDYYFEKSAIRIRSISELPTAFTRIIENQARRLLSFQ
ncbi:MAG: vWA domain-containing protein [Aquificaceae bacterium]